MGYTTNIIPWIVYYKNWDIISINPTIIIMDNTNIQ